MLEPLVRRTLVFGTAVCASALVAAVLATPSVATEWRSFGGDDLRHFFNPAESTLTRDNVARLGVKWTFQTDAIITAQPVVATVDLGLEGPTDVVFVQSWDGFLYALRLADGSEVWRFETILYPGVTFPNTGSALVADVGGVDRVFFGAGQTFYSLDAATGSEVWRFEAGTGCAVPPDLCGFDGERNQIETSPVMVDGKVVFGMDVNDKETGKGGIYAVDAGDGRLSWFFDLESGSTCTPLPGDDIRNFDGYHSETDLGLPAGFLTTRPGCNFDRTPTGCGNVWASPAADDARQLLYFASSNCDTDLNPATNRPPPPMPPYDEAIFALDYDGVAVWRWRPREEDTGDLAFGATPQLFTIDFGGDLREVVGVGNKDGTYYVLDRDGVNEVSGVAWNDLDPSTMPYWTTSLVPGGAAGGVIGPAAIDVASGRIYAGTAPGFDPLNPQRPTVHAMNLDTGAIVWQNTSETNSAASFGPTSGIPGLVLSGDVGFGGGNLRFYDADTGEKLLSRAIAFPAVACAATVVDGTVLVGGGVGELNSNPNASSHVTAQIPVDVTALCALGTDGCPARLAGKKIAFADADGAPSKRKVVVLAKDPETMVSPAPGSAEDPTLVDASLTITNPSTGETQTVALPSAGWSGIGNPAGVKGYKYKDSGAAFGPCSSVQIKAGKLVKAVCRGAGLSFSLDETSQGEIAVSLNLGAGGTWQYCAAFGGQIIKDEGTSVTAGKGSFKAKAAVRPASCP